MLQELEVGGTGGTRTRAPTITIASMLTLAFGPRVSGRERLSFYPEGFT